MCGIGGFIQQNTQRVSVRSLLQMRERLRHRGPDDGGYFLADTQNPLAVVEQGDVGLAHRRLSIIDPSPLGHQPMSNGDKTIWVNYNGEVYNFQELRGELVRRGHKFNGRSDTEVIVYAFQEWGINCIEQFIGMFAISIWDGREQKLYLVRDRLGIKPLYYYYKEGNFAFASELKAIMEYPYFDKELDPESLYRYLAFQYVPAPRAIFKNTYKLMPGHYLIISKNGDFEEHIYWDAVERFQALNKTGHYLNEEEALAELEELLISSVQYRLISDVPLGILLSGGVDSSLVASIAQSISPEQVKTFTIGFSEEGVNEAPYAHQIAKYLGTDHHELYITPKEAQAVIPELPLFYDEPLADPSSIPTYLVSKLARQNVKVVLSGDGGDELFGGYHRYARMQALARYYDVVPRPLRQVVCLLLKILPEAEVMKACKLAGLLLPAAFQVERCEGKKDRMIGMLGQRDALQAYPAFMATWQKVELTNLLQENISANGSLFNRTQHKGGKGDITTQLMLADLTTYLVDDVLVKVDRASMAVSLEDRVPILDHRIVEYTFGLSSPLKSKKHVLRKLLSRYLPSEMYERPKQGFGVPLAEWLRGDLQYLLQEYLNATRVQHEGFFNPGVVEQMVKEFLSGRQDHSMQLWSLVVFALWYENYDD